MYIIEFEKGVYATKGSGDPARTLKVENAQRFSNKVAAKTKLGITLEKIKPYRKFSNPKVRWVDEVTGELTKQI